ncbi:MAG: penicillin-binding Tp47 domain C-containing protein [Anaerostipes hadrus]|nr:penicillin-binding Tp47 domain C-containing protein [Anaerostipes hadrus]
MRKRLIGKAFAIAMSGAMVLTATPVTTNIFNVAHIVKAADEQSDEYVYCYAGLTWNEYWASEGVYAADNTSSSNELDGHGEYDKGGYDAVTRATTNHGLHRGSFQCISTIYTTDGSAYQISNWEQVKDTDGKVTATYLHLKDVEGRVTFNKGTLTFADNSTKKMDHYSVSGIKYVPVKVKASDYNDFKAKYSVVENNGTLIGGYAEGVLSSYEASANVTTNTNGLKEAVKGSDGSFSFKARTTGADSGIKNQTLQKAVKITPTVKDASGSYGEFLRVDLNGDDYGALGDKMQAVKWTYYGNDSTRTKALASYGTKFAADNWMHKSMGIQLGLTDSIRCQLPENTDGTGYWSLTVYALGYEDYTINFEATKDNIVSKSVPASDEEKASLQKLVTEAESLKKDSYVDSSDKQTAFTNLQTELDESKELLNKKELTSSEVSEQITHLTEAIKAVKALKTKDAATTTAAPSTTKPAATTTVTNTTTVKAPAKTTVKLSKAKKTSIKVSWKKVSGVAAYQIQYSTSKNFKNAKTVKVSAKSASKVLKKLKKNKKYYVRVRSYKVTKVNNKSKNVYSAWSAKKALKTKKK